ncbi:MAG TPA: aminoacetone oxidase family FAD-binding enzyme, partial [Firmicutes bacterium]|nr:aminoacetone oxidase family FAD-binding enzyme [Bacillota bacterium]
GKKLDGARGDLLFTHFGLSGPAVLDVSHAAARARSQQLQTFIVIDLLPAMSKEEIRSALEKQGQKTVGNGLSALLPAQLGKALGNDKYIKGLAPSTLNQLAGGLKAVRLEIIDVLGNNHAMVSQGGVNLRQVNPRTMESKLISGLYIAGEMLDYHGKTGGFNLHAAFATGWLAGENA